MLMIIIVVCLQGYWGCEVQSSLLDLHFVKNDWGITKYPVTPGHEVIGVVTEVGSKVEKFKIGNKVGVQTNGFTNFDGTQTYGGYSDHMVADEHFVLRWPENLPLDSGAPLLCAGVTTYSPLKYFGLDKPGTKVGVVGFSWLGHVAVKMAKAFGAEVTVFSTSPAKEKEGIEGLKADHFINSKDEHQMQAVRCTLDGIIDTVSANHAIAPLLNALTPHGKLVLVGAPEKPLEVAAFSLLMETQEMLDFAAKYGITADIEVVAIDYVKSDVRYRFVIDVANSIKAE
ncbi:putative mannitol dehydrogenase [Helianthus annuus]|nr:putative mannitol dehydrogenase [Helianthus annuus]